MYWTSLDSQFRFTVLFVYTAVDECNHIILIWWFLVIVSLVTSAGPTGVRKLLVPCLIDKWNFCSMQFNLSNVFVCTGPADPSGSSVSDHLPSLTWSIFCPSHFFVSAIVRRSSSVVSLWMHPTPPGCFHQFSSGVGETIVSDFFFRWLQERRSSKDFFTYHLCFVFLQKAIEQSWKFPIKVPL